MKKVGLLLVMFFAMIFAVAQKKDQSAVKKSGTVRLKLTPHNIETLSFLVKKGNGLRMQLAPIQKEIGAVDSVFTFIIETKLDAAGLDPKKGRWGIVGNELLYIPNKVDSSKIKISSSDSASVKPK